MPGVTPAQLVSPVQALAALAPDLFNDLSELEQLIVPFAFELWRRPEQIISRDDWRYLTYICGRGKGKTWAIATEVNRRVESGEATAVGLMAPTEDRVEEVQIKALIETAPPWFKPERYLGGLIWPNGVKAEVHTPIVPDGSRSSNFDLVWLTEIVAWQKTTRLEAFKTITTACRTGKAQVIADTTSKGKNEVIEHLLELHAKDPDAYPMIRGSTFDNPMLSRKYLKAECAKYVGQEFGEEIMGLVYRQAAGASFKQAWIDRNRVKPEDVPPLARKIVSIDPSLVSTDGADDKGIVVGGDDGAGHAYILADLSGPWTPEEWGDIAVEQCAEHGAAGVVIETNHMGEQAGYTIKSRAAVYKSAEFPHGLQVRYLPKSDGKPFPPRKPGIIYIREKFSRGSKQTRAGGAASETEAGHAHMVGRFATLEGQLTTFIDGGGQRSPNQYDAHNQLIDELCDLAQETPKRAPAAQAAEVSEAQALMRKSWQQSTRKRTI